MCIVNDAVCNKCVVGIAYRNDKIACAAGAFRIIIKYVAQLGEHDPGKFFFQQLICAFLQILVYCQIDVIARFRFSSAYRISHFSKVVHIESGLPLLALKHAVKCLFKP